MGFFDRFRRHTIRDTVTLVAFVDEQSLLLAESSVRDYSRLRAAAAADALLADASFAAALDKARWEAYPRALAMTGAVLEAKLRPHAGDHAQAMQSGLVTALVDAFDHRDVPKPIGDTDWRSARGELLRSLQGLADQQPKSVETIVDDHASFYLAIMPLHPRLSGDDFQALRRQLTAALRQIEERFNQRAELAALVAQFTRHSQGETSVTPG